MATHNCPVCGMKVDDQKTVPQSKYGGTVYYFCCADCKSKFDANPLQYTITQAAS